MHSVVTGLDIFFTNHFSKPALTLPMDPILCPPDCKAPSSVDVWSALSKILKTFLSIKTGNQECFRYITLIFIIHTMQDQRYSNSKFDELKYVTLKGVKTSSKKSPQRMTLK